MNYIVLKYKPVNRQQKKVIEKEILKAAKAVGWIEEKFIEAIFEETNYSYEQIYLWALEIWKNNVSILYKVNKVKHIYIDEHYFSDNYKPIERLKV